VSPKDPASLAETIRRHRERAGLSQQALAKRIGVPASTVHRLERAEVEAPDPDKLERLAAVLEIDPEELFAKYPAPEKLPDMAPYLRAKYAMSKEAVVEAEQFFSDLAKREKQRERRRRAKRAR
jgi:transcriptional regulator with XRE-family HTH domain